MSTSVATEASTRWLDHFTADEIKELRAMHDWHSWWSIAVDWALIAASFALVARWPNPLTIVLALFIIGSRQLGLAVLMHEAAHRTLLKNRALNDWVGNWICAFPIWSDARPYRPYHLQHHGKTGTVEDPDLNLITPFPITRESLRRKIWRDLSGQTGWKRARATFKRDTGLSAGRVKRNFDAGIDSLYGVAITNAVLFAILWLTGYPWLYLLWIAAWLTTYSLVMRIRSIAEHAMTPDQSDDLRNTRTTIPRWWERLFIAPNFVNYHLEHHLIMTIPHYNLPRMHRLLRARGVLDHACIAHGYPEILRLAASKAA